MNLGRHKLMLFLLAASVVLIFFITPQPGSRTKVPPWALPPFEEAQAEDGVVVTKIVDGDTIEIEGGSQVRYIGIDAPELYKDGAVTCSGREALKRNAGLVYGKTIRLEKDVSETDQYGRLLRYVWIDGEMLNELLVREGYAKSASFPPDIAHRETLLEAEQQAKEQSIGLWGELCVDLP